MGRCVNVAEVVRAVVNFKLKLLACGTSGRMEVKIIIPSFSSDTLRYRMMSSSFLHF